MNFKSRMIFNSEIGLIDRTAVHRHTDRHTSDENSICAIYSVCALSGDEDCLMLKHAGIRVCWWHEIGAC